MKNLNFLFINGSLHFAIKYLGYLVWQVFALTVKTVIYLLLFGYVLALIVIVLITACAPLCSLSMCFGTEVWEATLMMLDLYGLFLVLLAATAGMQHIIDYVILSPEGTLLHPIPPVQEEPLLDAQVLVRASIRSDDLLLRPASAQRPMDRPELLLRAAKANRTALL